MQVNERMISLKKWLNAALSPRCIQYEPLSGDASFRRYFRVFADGKSYVLMDAPPRQEACHHFVAIAKTFRAIGLKTPEIYDADLEKGFLLLSDFGDHLYLHALNATTAQNLYQRAFDALITIARCPKIDDYVLPKFDEALYREEMNLFRDWYLGHLLGIKLTNTELQELERIYRLLIEDALSQPQVCVHRDYHSRNLMVLPDDQIGILDFQDAVWGPITYDLLSLLRDCYIAWPIWQVEKWALQFQQQLINANLLTNSDSQQFLRWFDWIGLQRNLKCIGIFSRLHLRDKKSGYLQEIPRVLRYAEQVCARYPEFADLGRILQKYVWRGS